MPLKRYRVAVYARVADGTVTQLGETWVTALSQQSARRFAIETLWTTEYIDCEMSAKILEITEPQK